jgi:hypothetical protein
MKVCVLHRLTSIFALIELEVDVCIRIQYVCYFRCLETCFCKLFGGSGVCNVGAWNDEDMTLGRWIDRLEDKDFLIPRAMMDGCDCNFLVLNDITESALFVVCESSKPNRYLPQLD